uniref:CARD domain-containing protein n=1 Tax=Sinocyclocheilus rhinocerous TaxID=307959 RepID=A0A673GFC5_9TELE
MKNIYTDTAYTCFPLEKVLEQLRIKLKEGLTEAVIKNLLDDLRVKKVLGNEEIEEIVQKTKPRADQARDLIDGVSRKGTKASEIMLVQLHEAFSNHVYFSFKYVITFPLS